MIISDQHQFVFVHIPKCAGTFIRNKLKIYDDYNGDFARSVVEHTDLGLLDYGHLPLHILRDYFDKEYKKIESYWTFAVVRDPFERFSSSLSQRIKMYGSKAVQEMNKQELVKNIDQVIDFLVKHDGKNELLPIDYIHFQRQVDYIFLDNEKIIKSIFLMNHLELLPKEFIKQTGQVISFNETDSKANQVIVTRNRCLHNMMESTRPITGMLTKHMSEHLKNKIRSFIYIPRDKRFNDIFKTEYVKDFIAYYYKDDINLIKDVKN